MASTSMRCAAILHGRTITPDERWASPVSIGRPACCTFRNPSRTNFAIVEHERRRLLPIAAGRPAYLRTRGSQPATVQRVEQLEELFRLAQDKRFAPSSEKLKDRVFDEAEQIAATEADDDDAEVGRRVRPAGHRAAGNAGSLRGASVGASHCRPICRASVLNTTCLKTQKVCPCCAQRAAPHGRGNQRAVALSK